MVAFLLLGLLGIVALRVIGTLDTGSSELLAGGVVAVLPVPLYVLLALWIDRYEKEPLSMLWLAFLWGATGAIAFSLVLNALGAQFLEGLGGPLDAELRTAVLSAPLVEETSKGLALFLLFFWKRHEFDNLIDGVLYATMVGLGFAMMENVIYYAEALERGPEASRTVFLVRGVLTPYAHPFFTAMMGIGLGIARETARTRLRLAAPAAGMAAAVLLHAVWNLSTGFGMVFFGAYFLVMVPAFLGMLGLVAYAQRRERRIIRTQLRECVEEGVLRAEELEALSRFGGRTRGLWRALREEGIEGWRREERLHHAAAELAFHRWRVTRGLSLGPAADAAFEAAHLAAIRRDGA